MHYFHLYQKEGLLWIEKTREQCVKSIEYEEFQMWLHISLQWSFLGICKASLNITFWKNERGNQLETQNITLHYSLSEKYRPVPFLKILHWEAALLAKALHSAAVAVRSNSDNRFSFHFLYISLSRDLPKSHFWTLSQSRGFLILFEK